MKPSNASHPSKHTRFPVLLTVLLLLVVLGSAYLPVHGETAIYDSVIRLHVLANSDSEEDQARKLLVRDAILADSADALSAADNRDDTIATVEALIPHLTEVAENALRAAGCDDPVRITFTREHYPTRNYEAFCFPSGEYLSLRVLIGDAAGQNWWCVLFPPLCLGAATVSKSDAEEQFIAVGLSREQYGVITETEDKKYKLRFKFLETFEEMFGEE